MDIIERASPNFDPRPPRVAIDMVVLHYTGMPNADAALARLADPVSRVSAHYVIDEDGAVYRMVSEGGRAWHAGAAYWRGSTDVNARSIGIELVNPGHEYGYRPFADAQMAADILESVGWVCGVEKPTPGRTAFIYYMNPKILERVSG